MCSDMLPVEHDELLSQTDDESLTASLVSKENWTDEEMNKETEEGNTTRTNTPSNSLLSEEQENSTRRTKHARSMHGCACEALCTHKKTYEKLCIQ